MVQEREGDVLEKSNNSKSGIMIAIVTIITVSATTEGYCGWASCRQGNSALNELRELSKVTQRVRGRVPTQVCLTLEPILFLLGSTSWKETQSFQTV